MILEPRNMDSELMVLEVVIRAMVGRHTKEHHRGIEFSGKKKYLEARTSLFEGLGLEEA